MNQALDHLRTLHEVFMNEGNFETAEKLDYDIYRENEEKFRETLSELDFNSQLYGIADRQMILADLFEYIFVGRGYYAMQSKKDKENFVKAILHFVNLLMCYEVMTVSNNLREKVLEKLEMKIATIKDERLYRQLKAFRGRIGLKKGESSAPPDLNTYFDSMLPKTAGGLWHELLVYIFLLRNNVGYILPLLLSQRLIGLPRSIVPPDFLVITHDKHIYGIEVGTKKEIQSGSFSLQTNIPTATIDTQNSRASDRCPICKRWLPFCQFVIEKFSNFDEKNKKAEIRCLRDCKIYSETDVAEGKCPYTKYSRKKAKTLEYTHHQYADGLHYHYKCVLENVQKNVREKMVTAKDEIALKMHYPFYSGLEELIKDK